MVLVTGQVALLAVLVLMVKLLVVVVSAKGADDSCETAGLAWVEIALLLSKAKVVSPVVIAAVLPVFVLVGVVPVVPVLPVLPVPVPEVPVGSTQFTLVAPTVQFVLKFERLFNVLLTQPDTLVAAINRAKR